MAVKVVSQPSWERALEVDLVGDVCQAIHLPACDVAPTAGRARGWWRVRGATCRWCVSVALHGSLLAYAGYCLMWTSSTRGPHAVVDGRGRVVTGALYTSVEGLQMTLHQAFPTAMIMAHHLSSTLLVPLMVGQKWLVPHMRYKRRREGGATRLSADGARALHSTMGMVTLMAMGCMTVTGFRLRHASAFYGMRPAMVLFAMPWVVLLVSVPVTAKRRSYLGHLITGNIAFKSAVAVPLARVLSTAIQRMCCRGGSPGSMQRTLGRSYYAGIALSAAVMGTWAVLDTLKFVRLYRGEEPATEADASPATPEKS